MESINSKSKFDDIIKNSEVPVFVKFTASWCGPCKMMIPLIEKASGEFKNIKFVEVDVDDGDGLPEVYSISSVPTMIIFKNGKEFDRISGAMPYDNLESFLKGSL